MKRLLTIGHSYVVGSNRRLAHEMAVAGAGRWSVTAAAPAEYPGDLRRITLEPFPGEASGLVALGTRAARMPQLMVYRGLRQLLNQPWDIVHCWEEPYVAAAAQIARRLRPESRLVLATFQNIPKDYPFPFATFERRVLDRAIGWIAFGKTTYDAQIGRLERYRSLPSRVIPPGVDTAVFAPSICMREAARDTLGWHDDIPVVGYLGRFVPEKGLETLLSALSQASVPWRALFVGDGPQRERLSEFAATRGDQVRIVTDATHDEVPRWLNAMDVLCAPSLTTPRWREQFGRMLVEAMACGVSVIASDSGEIPRVIGDAGVVTPEGNVPRLTAALECLLRNPTVRREYSRRGRERAVRCYGWNTVAADHLRFFEELV